MTSSLLPVLVALVGLIMALRLTDAYAGGHYACPGCGAKRADRHGPQCPWRR